jgi:replicative DNA helicase
VVETPAAELIIAKQRNGATTTVDLTFIGEQYRFAEA